MEKTVPEKNGTSCSAPNPTSDTKDIQSSPSVNPPRYSYSSPSADEIRENRNIIIKILDTLKTLKTLSEIRTRNELQQQNGVDSTANANEALCGHCPCTQRSVIEADIKYLQQLLARNGYKISKADCTEAYQASDIIKSARLLYQAVEKLNEAEGVDTKRPRLDVRTLVAGKREAILKALLWIQNKRRSQYSFDVDRSEFSVVPNVAIPTENSEIFDLIKNAVENF